MSLDDRRRAGMDLVRSAFAAVRAPALPLVDCPCPECEELEQRLAGKAWTDVDAALAEELETDLPLLNGSAFRALLPAFLLAGFEEACGEFLVYGLEPGDYNTPRFEGLTDEQGAAVLAFLRWCVADAEADGDEIYVDDPRRAIEGYWGRFA